ncbi:bis(5'-nucleosyl)-tetraphosphatase (symmetrical) YqeK [bacterium]|nr:bis(5'-nucleosyl)-tetraphosphatase (symmetrical) YqeK [bacterium]
MGARPPDRAGVEASLRGRLSPRLFEHSRHVAALAERLASLHGCDPDWAYLAGMYHDLGKILDLEQMISAAKEGGIEFDEMESLSPSLMHAAASAAFFKSELAPPENFVRAVRGHTLGGAPFTREEMILYISDFAEPTRAYEECAAVRQTAERDLVRASIETVSFKIRFLLLKNRNIHPKSILLYNHLLERAERKQD